jgi:hypothetical protein
VSCHRCEEHPATVLATFAAGDPMADLRAASTARQARENDPARVHVHYDPQADTFVVLRDSEYRRAA